MDIHGKVVVITGASGGIGLATARCFAKEGAKLVLAARSADKLDQLVSELRQQGVEAAAVPTDVRKVESVRQMVEAAIQQFGRVDVLINNAGQAIAGTIAEINTDDLHQIIDLNVFGPIYAMQAVVPVMRRQGGGIIVNISSMTSKMTIPGLAGYASTKAALNLITQTARGELAADNIRVLLVLPRMTETDFGKNSLGNQQSRQHQRSGGSGPRIVDSPDYVANRIFEAVRDETPEKYMDEG